MKTIAFVCAALFTVPVVADEMVSYKDGNTIRLANAECTSAGVVNRLAPELIVQFRAASVDFEGRNFAACWRATPAGALLIYEDGDQGLVPFNTLKPLLSV